MAESNETTIIGADSHFKGELSFENTAKINGKFDGQVSGKGQLQVSENALCKADIDAGSVQIDGTIEGNLRAKDTIRLNGKGVVKGDITAAKMVMAEGASFFGQCAVGPDAAKRGGEAGGGASTTSGGAPTGGGQGGGQGGGPRR